MKDGDPSMIIAVGGVPEQVVDAGVEAVQVVLPVGHVESACDDAMGLQFLEKQTLEIPRFGFAAFLAGQIDGALMPLADQVPDDLRHCGSLVRPDAAQRQPAPPTKQCERGDVLARKPLQQLARGGEGDPQIRRFLFHVACDAVVIHAHWTIHTMKTILLTSLLVAGLVASAPGASLLYDGFVQSAGDLDGQTGGTGLSAWTVVSGAATTVTPTFSYGDLANAGNQAATGSSGARVSATTSAFDGTGLLANDAELWFSFVAGGASSSSDHSGFGYGTIKTRTLGGRACSVLQADIHLAVGHGSGRSTQGFGQVDVVVDK